MKLNMDIDNLRLRLKTVLLILPAFLLPVFLGGIYFEIFLIFLSLILFYELTIIINYSHKKIAITVFLFSLILSLIILKNFPGITHTICLAIMLMGSIFIRLFIRTSMWFIAISSYSYMAFLIFHQLRLQDNLLDGLFSLLLIIFIAIISDTSGYLGGQLAGRKKIFPNLSPNKTVEGTLFAVFIPTLFFFVIFMLYGVNSNSIALSFFILLITIGAILGDMLGSFFKRSFSFKNSSDLLPGHGGLLDRLDSVIGSGIAFLILANIVSNTNYENILYFWR